ncbi:VBA1 (YMR088C) [Zygosaccharomyces parabailii]|nr:VBA1 (YMR088C) [Zygosaccharomyces parabailii]CDH16112.1 probable Vacuolar basic amino acid transporter 1 [Zygosaccharomyces bailii ISA1307]SJM83195.1 probable Vacuolar basic amino acid transporter 1 [Zygosaccharomyces bailii]
MVDDRTPLISSEPGDDDALEEEYHRYNLALPKLPILTALWLGSFISSLDGTIVANIMNKVAEEFEESNKKQWIATSFLLTNTAFQPLYGKLSDITGRRFAILTAHFFFGIGCLLTCFAQNVTQFAIARAICGIGGGGINACSSITVSDICTAKDRGVYQGYANIVFGMGQMLGAPIGGLLIETIGWRTIFAVQVPIISLCSFLAYRNVKIRLSHLPPVSQRFTLKNLSRIDLLGSSSLVAVICGVLFLCSTNLNKVGLTIFTLLSFALFVVVELYYAKERILPLELLKGAFGLCSVATIVSSFITYGDIFRSPIYYQVVQNLSVTKTGFFILLPALSVAVGSVITGSVLRRTKMDLAHCCYVIVLQSVAIQLAGLLLAYVVINLTEPAIGVSSTDYAARLFYFSSNSLWWKVLLVSAGMIIGYGYAGLLVSTLVSIVCSIEKSQQATMTGIFYLWRSIGNVLGVSLTLVIYENSLAKAIWRSMFGSENDGSYSYTKKEYHKLISDSSYLRSHFSATSIEHLLSAYRTSFLTSYLPSIGLAVLGLVISWALVKVNKFRQSKTL